MRLPLSTRLYYSVGRHLPFLKIRPPQVDREAVLRLRPGRNPALSWEQIETGETILVVPHRPAKGRIIKLMGRWMQLPDTRKVELDEVGGYVWGLCDGTNSVDSIVRRAVKEYKLNRREAEVSVTMFLEMLHERRFIGFYERVKNRS